MASSKRNYVPNAPSPNTFTLGVRASIRIWICVGGAEHTFLPITSVEVEVPQSSYPLGWPLANDWVVPEFEVLPPEVLCQDKAMRRDLHFIGITSVMWVRLRIGMFRMKGTGWMACLGPWAQCVMVSWGGPVFEFLVPELTRVQRSRWTKRRKVGSQLSNLTFFTVIPRHEL